MKSLAILLFCLTLHAQQVDGWIQSLQGRFSTLHNRVTATYAIGTLAAEVCPAGEAAARELFRDALTRLNNLTPENFTVTADRLRAPTLTALDKLIEPAAQKCAPDLISLIDRDRMNAKLASEKNRANTILRDAEPYVSPYPDRAAQLIEAALSVGDPSTLDIQELSILLYKLRARAPELADEAYSRALEFLTSAPQPSPARLMDLGRYLFTTAAYADDDEKEERNDTITVGSAEAVNFEAVRTETNPDDIRAYIDSGLKVLTAFDSPYFNAATSYAIASQLLTHAIDVAPELTERLREALDRISPGTSRSASHAINDAAALRSRGIARTLSAIAANDFRGARDLLTKVDDIPSRGQTAPLIDFAEAVHAISAHDFQWAYTLTNHLRPGIKRTLLYASIAAVDSDKINGLTAFHLAMRDIALLPAEQRTYTWALVTNGIAGADPESAYVALTQLVAASNDARTSPRKGRFDPAVTRRFSRKGADVSTDSALILYSQRGFTEVIDTGGRRSAFQLSVPGVSALTLPAALRTMKTADVPRLESIALELRDESQLADALNAIAVLRLRR